MIKNDYTVEPRKGMAVEMSGGVAGEPMTIVRVDKDLKVFDINYAGNELYSPPDRYQNRPWKELIKVNDKVCWNHDG